MNSGAKLSQDDAKIYRDQTGGLTDSGMFKAIYEIHGKGRSPRIGQEIVLRTPEGNICGYVIDSGKEGRMWYTLVEPLSNCKET